MKEGDKINYKGEEYTIIFIEDGVAHLLNEKGGIAILITEL